ncbi:MAG: glycerophosphodiester phosphodiesterase [Moraxellaceae bacterium]|nr:MAG: glycerophosphodiester phosphodiesterase [Moraxellaceae bacterium]
MIIVGHRGARHEAPENTLAGFRYLRSLDIHHVELDLQLSKDNQLVVIHDKTVDRTTAHSGYIANFTADDLAKMNAAYHFPEWDSHSGIPLLDEILIEWCELKTIQLEVKPPTRAQFPILAQALSNLIIKHALESTGVVTSKDVRFLAYMHEHFPAIKRGLVAKHFTRNPVGICAQLHCQYLVLDWRRCNKRLVTKAHQQKLHVSVWTVNSLYAALKVSSYNVDSIITDVPTALSAMIKEQ